MKESPISIILAGLKLRKLEEIKRRKFKNIIVHWFRYVEDIFALIKEDYVVENLINELNSIDNIKFTYEAENRKLNYLGVNINITRTENNIFETRIYRKAGSR